MPAFFRSLIFLFGTAALASAEVDFRQQVQPVLENACIRCHGADKVKGGLRLDTHEGLLKGGKHGPVINTADLKQSDLLRRITLPRDHEDIMPQETEPLTGPHKNWLVEWVKSGAKWPAGVVLQMRKKGVPGLAETQLIPAQAPASLQAAASAADRILDAENAAAKGPRPAVAPMIDDLAFLRRATVDLIGRIPTTEEIAEFEKASAGDRREKLIDKLLAHPRFAERWTVFFADMLRIRSRAEGGAPFLAYINQSIAQGKPYDQLARELIATNGRADLAPAVGFVLGDAANPMSLAGATAQVFLGVRIGCAECHDHPFDDWKQREFYELAAFFGQTKRVEQGKLRKTYYTTEGTEMKVQWPPEKEQAPKRAGVKPKFPFEMISLQGKPHYIARLEDRRKPPAPDTAAVAKKALDDLIDNSPTAIARRDGTPANDVFVEAITAARNADIQKSLYQQSQLRAQLAEYVTDPRNPYFARAFVNRIWAELIGHGFVEPLDNFSNYNEMRHPQTLQFLAQEFTANGYDLRTLLKTVMLTTAYQRTHLPAGSTTVEATRAEESFTATRSRRMLGEVLFDSIATAGHLLDFKWPAGANTREVTRQIRIPLAPPAMVEDAATPTPSDEPNMAPNMLASKKGGKGPAPYDLERGEKLDFEALLKQDSKEVASMKRGGSDTPATKAEILAELNQDFAMLKKKEDDAAEAQRQARNRLLRSGLAERFRLETIKETLDDNPRFDSTLRMATPAPPSHFLRVFGQPSREGLGEFRDESPSLRQELMMLNGKATHEAARVGPLEPIHALIAGPKPQPEKAIELAYLETLTRRPTAEELAEARAIISSTEKPVEGLADLRWSLLNCHEFRYLP